MTPEDYYFMHCALNMANKAFLRGDVPVGAVVVKDNAVIASGSDIKSYDPTSHAEIIALRESAKILGRWNLIDCSLYVTLEPCPMCAGACVNARVSRVIYGAKNYKSGAVGTLYNILQDTRLNHTCEVISGIMETECKSVLQAYFLLRREGTHYASDKANF